MTLSSIKSMFVPGAFWAIEYSGEIGKRTPFRQVHKVRGNEIVWDTGSASKFHTTWPKASEVITAEPGLLVFRYTEHRETFSFRLLTGEEAEAAATYLAEARIKDAAFRAAEKLKDEETKARLAADFRKAREDKFRKLETVTAWELIEALRENGIPVSPGTVGTLRKKIQTVTKDGWSYLHRVRPRFSYETQPAVLYMKVHDHLLLQDLAAPIPSAPEATAEELAHLFGTTPEANVTPQPLRSEDTPILSPVAGTTSPSPSQGQPVPDPTTALDLFAA